MDIRVAGSLYGPVDYLIFYYGLTLEPRDCCYFGAVSLMVDGGC